jgi:peptidylprolyl isomerase
LNALRTIGFSHRPRRNQTLLAATLAVVAALGFAAAPNATWRSSADILAAAPESAWRTPDPRNLLYMLIGSSVVIIELAPDFAPAHVANIQALAAGHFWDATSIYRSQDNFVVQFGDAEADDPAKAKSLGDAKSKLPAEFHREAKGLAFDRLPDVDGWAPEAGFSGGFAVARDPKANRAWMTHCYGVVGAGRNNEPDSSNGAELYVVIGQAPRQLDDNITVVGRVLQGMEVLSAIRRGPSPAGFYEDPAQRTPIRAIRLASEVPESARIALQVLRTDSQTFRDVVESRRNRVDDFYKRPAGHIDLCNVSVPTRATPDAARK